jgi:hypothetical protein
MALRLRTNAVPTGLAWQPQADPDRVDPRRADYRLLRVRGLVEQLRAGLPLATDPAQSARHARVNSQGSPDARKVYADGTPTVTNPLGKCRTPRLECVY